MDIDGEIIHMRRRLAALETEVFGQTAVGRGVGKNAGQIEAEKQNAPVARAPVDQSRHGGPLHGEPERDPLAATGIDPPFASGADEAALERSSDAERAAARGT
jgi:hypothetical protein